MTQTDNVSVSQPIDTMAILNSKLRDSSSKIIFDNNILCSQFLRDYIDLPCLKDVQPEDIEDVSDQFVPLFAEERNADRVKRVHIKGENPFFLLSLIEHKTKPDYNVSIQIFRYMIYIWDSYEKEAEKFHDGISRQSCFKYPPILPIVYYEGKDQWAVPLDFKSRIIEGELFQEYIPDFKYYLVPLRSYSNDELIAKEDEISLVMLINKLQTPEDIEDFRSLSVEKIEAILQDSPKHLVDIIADILLAFLLKENVPIPEAEELAHKVRKKKMAQLFENMEKMDIQAERRNTTEQRMRAEAAEQKTREAEQKALAAAQRAETGIQAFIEGYQELEVSKEITLQKLIDKFQLDEAEANIKLALYWTK